MAPKALQPHHQFWHGQCGIITLMKAALTTSHGRMAPCFAGVELRILGEYGGVPSRPGAETAGQAGLAGAQVVSTHGWHPLCWGRELWRRDVALLLCAGIDQGTWAAIRGHGIEVIPNAIGDPETVFAAWHGGRLNPPRLWPAYPVGLGRAPRFREGRRRRFRGGRG